LAEVRELRPPDAAAALADAAAAAAATGGAPVALVDPRTKYDLPLASTERLSHDTYLLRFALPSAAHRVGLPCGKHVFVFADVAGETVARAYTPVSSDRDLGQLSLMVKVYWPTERFPAGGKMSQHLASLKPGDTISVKGPVGKVCVVFKCV
jgi:NAD(P)H-flavin reductase